MSYMTPISMIDIDTWPIKVTAIVLGGAFLLTWSCLLGGIYISRKYLGRLLEAFSRSPEARVCGARYNQGMLNRLLLVSILGQLLLFSKIYIKRGEVSAQDVREFPGELKRILLIDGILMCTSVVSFALVCILVEIRSGT